MTTISQPVIVLFEGDIYMETGDYYQSASSSSIACDNMNQILELTG